MRGLHDLSIQPHIIGVNVSETTSEMPIRHREGDGENSRNNHPSSLIINSSGRNAATSERLMEMTVNPTSRVPCDAVCRVLFPLLL